MSLCLKVSTFARDSRAPFWMDQLTACQQGTTCLVKSEQADALKHRQQTAEIEAALHN